MNQRKNITYSNGALTVEDIPSQSPSFKTQLMQVQQARQNRRNEISNWEAQRNESDYMARKPAIDFWSEMEKTAGLAPGEVYSKEEDPRNLQNFLTVKGISENLYRSNPQYKLDFKKWLEGIR
jgi:hypothetical protein